MENENKTHWKKNLDSRYISGEDLKFSLHGLSPEMSVCIRSASDVETFDQKNQTKEIATGLILFDIVKNKQLLKAVILNKTNAAFFIKETGSEFIEDWYNHNVTIYAKPDKRHNFVVRFKKYSSIPPPPIRTLDQAKAAFTKVTDRTTFVQAMNTYDEFIGNTEIQTKCTELSKLYPKPVK